MFRNILRTQNRFSVKYSGIFQKHAINSQYMKVPKIHRFFCENICTTSFKSKKSKNDNLKPFKPKTQHYQKNLHAVVLLDFPIFRNIFSAINLE